MNQNSSTDTSFSSQNGITAESISRRAYEIWEREGRPEGCDLKHWLQAEQELGIRRSEANSSGNPASERATADATSTAPRNTGTDTRPLQGTRAGAAAGRDQKRSSRSPFGEKATSSNGQNAAKRKPSGAPIL